MNSHGGVSSFTMRQQQLDPKFVGRERIAQRNGKQKPSDDDASFSGFQHFISKPTQEQQFTLSGKVFDPSVPQQWGEAERLMRSLAHFIRNAPKPKVPGIYNPALPSGFTYFTQLVAHDLVHSSVSLSHTNGRVHGLRNVRDTPLRLETIYGGGPTECPHAYQGDAAGFRSRLRLGAARLNDYDQSHRDPLRDIARGTVAAVPGSKNARYTEALIGDPRNDSHAIISQLVVLFHRLHNTIVKKLEETNGLPPTEDRLADSQRMFMAAQSACILIYRNIVRHDLLPRILHPDVRRAYEKNPARFVGRRTKKKGDWRVPVEFTNGFFRFAHSMIRPRYLFNIEQPTESGLADHHFDIELILNQTSEKGPELMPLEEKWLIDWACFFGTHQGDDNFDKLQKIINLSIRIGPWSSVSIGSENDKDDGGLIARDLLSSIAMGPWSIGALVGELRRHDDRAALLEASTFLNPVSKADKDPPWAESIRDWLSKRSEAVGTGSEFYLNAQEIRDLANDPPIPFFVRFEAGTDPDGLGTHLGILGSMVVADVIYGILQHDEIVNVGGFEKLTDQLIGLSKIITGRVSGKNIFGFLSEFPGSQGEISDFISLLSFLKSSSESTGS